METRKLRMLTEAGRLEALLESMVRHLGFLPDTARRLEEADELPEPLRELTSRVKGEKVWCAWRDGERLWFYAAEMSLPQSRERGRAVLRVTSYGPEAEIIDSGWWMRGKSWSQVY